MSKQFQLLTEKMRYLFGDIVGSLGQLPLEQRAFLFGFPDEEDMDWLFLTARYITMEYIKYAFDYDDPEYSLRHFRKENDTDDERMRQQRIAEFVLKYKKQEIARSGVKLPPDHKFSNVSMDDIKSKLNGYRFTEMNYFEHQNIHDLEFIKAIVLHRISSVKKIPNDRFQEIFNQYDLFIKDIIAKSQKNDQDMVFYSLAFFTLEWHYPIEFFYHLACLMEETDMQEINQSDLALLCGNVKIESRFGVWVSTQSRMVVERLAFADALFNREIPSFEKDEFVSLIKETIVLATLYKEIPSCNDEIKYIDWFRKESNICDWASFFRFYDVFSIWEKKEWTPKRIQNMRKLFQLTTTEK